MCKLLVHYQRSFAEQPRVAWFVMLYDDWSVLLYLLVNQIVDIAASDKQRHIQTLEQKRKCE